MPNGTKGADTNQMIEQMEKPCGIARRRGVSGDNEVSMGANFKINFSPSREV